MNVNRLFVDQLYVFEVYGASAWKYAWGVMTFFIVVMPLAYTNWIAPLFNKFTPLESGELRDQIEEYAEKLGFKTDLIAINPLDKNMKVIQIKF